MRRAAAMDVLADRFVPVSDGEAVDLATGDRVRVHVDPDPSRTAIRERTAICDRLATLRHPLLVPLIDYGMCGARWFEAHAATLPMRMTRTQARRTVLHVVRFLRAAGVELTAELAERNIRTAIEGGGAPGRPLGVFLRERTGIDALRTVLEAQGPPGTTSLDVIGPDGSGLRTARLQLARIARLAGYVVLDARADDAIVDVGARHVCAFDWMPPGRTLPSILGRAAAGSGRRHMWIRFTRAPIGAAGPGVELRLEPMMRDVLISAIFLDPELGPTLSEVRMAAEAARGRPALAIASLAGLRGPGGAGWVHETSPQYGRQDPATGSAAPAIAVPGLARLERMASVARGLAARGRHARAERLLSRCARALAARGDGRAAGAAACDLGDVLLGRGRPAGALDAYDRARTSTRDPEVTMRALIGTGRARLDQARLAEAEAAFRTAAAAEPRPSESSAARVWLARVLWHRGQFDDARVAVGAAHPALLSRILLAMGQLEAASQAARDALATSGTDATAVCEACLAAAHVHAALGDVAAVRRAADSAVQAARQTRNPALRLTTAADAIACLERCGVMPAAGTTRRLLRAAERLPRLAAARIRTALRRGTSADALVVPPQRAETDLVRHFQVLIDAMHDAADEAAALQVMAAELQRTLRACSVVIRSARLEQVVAAAGRSWPGEDTVARAVLNGGARITRAGATPDAVEPVRAAGAIVGTIALRWVAGANPSPAHVGGVLRLTAVAAAPLLRALKPAGLASIGEVFPDDLLGPSRAAEGVREAIRRAAAAPYPVLVEGESGSGKELVARAIHARGLRRARRFCAVNCAALTEDLLEAELFGHARGAFTGALSERAGLFEEADQGTLFLDEVGELSARAQAKLLRAVQEGEVRRLGENVPRRIDVRIVAATNRSLEREVQNGGFRADLRFRLDVIRITIPPLRERAEDLRWLVERIWGDAAARVGSRAVLGEDLVGALLRYDWPGNVRELQNVIASLAVHGPRRGRVTAALLPSRIGRETARASTRFDQARTEFERAFVRAALARAGGCRSAAAAQLGLSRQGLVKIIRRLGLE